MKVSIIKNADFCYVQATGEGFDSAWRVRSAESAIEQLRVFAIDQRLEAERALKTAERMEQAARILAQQVSPAPRRTITMERDSTRPHLLTLRSKGRILCTTQPGGVSSFARAQDAGEDVRAALRERARAAGFTHIRYSGDWGDEGAPRAGAL